MGLALQRLLISLILPVAVSLLTVPLSREPKSTYFFEVTLKTSTQGIAQLFYDPTGGDDAREENSARLQLDVVETPITHRFPLPEGRYSGFRFDPIDRHATVAFSGARIVRVGPSGVPVQVLSAILATRFLAARHVSSLKAIGDEVQLVTTEDANDPILTVSLQTPLLLGQDKTRERLEVVRALGQSVLFIWVFLWLINRLVTRAQASLSRGWKQTVEWADRHHTQAIAAMAIFAAILSCHPVVFFGKSFVSPDHGTYLLYEKFPTLPGYATTVLEDVRGADIGAPMWEHLPYSVVESHAILRDGELPLWNRYNSAGLTLLGQGMSMLGDPLHLGVILAGGASWAWDIKFVVAKTLFALGVGLTILACTGYLPASLILAFSSVFIGFFAFRFSHPAFFSLAYAPWILFCWLRIIQAPSQSTASEVRWLCGLVLANWTLMNSGTAKEAYMLLIFLNLTGSLVFLFQREEWRVKWRKGARLLFAEVLFVIVSAPIWVTFVEAIHESHSFYGNPTAIQIPPALFIGLFDDVFYRELISTKGYAVSAPSANFLILACLLWTVVRFRQLSADRTFLGIGLGAIITLAMVFGVVPASAIARTPFLGNVIHIHNTFSVVAIVHLVVLAGFGVKACCSRFARKQWALDMAFTVAMLGILLVLYLDSAKPAIISAFFVKYVATLVLAFVAFPVLGRILARKVATPELLLLLAASFIAIHWRHGMYLKTKYDAQVMNPQIRVNLQPHSPAIEFIKRDTSEAFRAVGFDNNLFAGYNASLGIESIYGCDALSNSFYRELMKALPIEWGMDWQVIVHKRSLQNLKPIYDFLNVGRYVDAPGGAPIELPGLTFEGRFDLDVYRSDTTWPRAFFTNQLATYTSTPEFVAMLSGGDSRPFAAVQDTELAQHPSLKALIGPRAPHVVPAIRYQLTNNTTTFTIAAPERGIVVLTEVYSEGDFSVTINGKPATVFRVNHAFKGVEIDGPGTYTVTFAYWPQYLSSSLWVSGAGLLLLSVWLFSHGVERQRKVLGRAMPLPA
jgi:hypothetical protein